MKILAILALAFCLTGCTVYHYADDTIPNGWCKQTTLVDENSSISIPGVTPTYPVMVCKDEHGNIEHYPENAAPSVVLDEIESLIGKL